MKVYVVGSAQDLNDWSVTGVFKFAYLAEEKADSMVAQIHAAMEKNAPSKMYVNTALGGYGHHKSGSCCREQIVEAEFLDR